MDTKDILLLIISVLLCGISFYMRVREQGKVEKNFAVYSGITLVLVVGIALMLQLFYVDNLFFNNVRMVALLSLMAPIAYIDFREFRIPNYYIILGIVYWVLSLGIELWMDSQFLVAGILSSLIAAGALFLAAALCKVCVHGAIGAGDMKLFVVMGLLLRLDGIWGAMILSLILSFFVALYFLITRKKGRKDEMAFGPALALGTMISIFLTGV